MNVKLKKLFSLVEEDSNYFHDNVDKIQLEKCPRDKQMCKEHLAIVNNSHVESNKYRYDKNFQGSIETLKNAFYVTFELNEKSCKKCTNFFRSTLTKSLEDMHVELGKMSKGIFKTKRYQTDYIETSKVLMELKNLKKSNIVELNKQKHYFVGSFQDKWVS